MLSGSRPFIGCCVLIRPGLSYFVGGNTKVYGAALFRLRE